MTDVLLVIVLLLACAAFVYLIVRGIHLVRSQEPAAPSTFERRVVMLAAILIVLGLLTHGALP